MKKPYATLLLASALLAGCAHDALDTPSPRLEERRALQLTSGITTGVTRAFDSSWDAKDSIGVFTVKAGTTDVTSSGSYKDENIQYKTDVTTATGTATGSAGSYTYSYQTFSAANDNEMIYLPADGSAVDVYAYYPYRTGITGSNPLSITIPGTSSAQTLAEQKAVDVLYAKATEGHAKATEGQDQSGTAGPIDIDHYKTELLFKHLLSKVLICVKTGKGYTDEDLSNLSVRITGQPVEAKLYPLRPETTALEVTAGQTLRDVTPMALTFGDADWSRKGDGISLYRALILPNGDANAADDGTRQIVFTVYGDDGAKTEYPYTIEHVFEPGQETLFKVSLNATDIVVTAAITPWSEDSTVPETPLYEE